MSEPGSGTRAMCSLLRGVTTDASVGNFTPKQQQLRA